MVNNPEYTTIFSIPSMEPQPIKQGGEQDKIFPNKACCLSKEEFRRRIKNLFK